MAVGAKAGNFDLLAVNVEVVLPSDFGDDGSKPGLGDFLGCFTLGAEQKVALMVAPGPAAGNIGVEAGNPVDKAVLLQKF